MHIRVRKFCLGLAKHPVLGTPHGIPFGIVVCESKTNRVLLTTGAQSRGAAPFKLIDVAVHCLSFDLQKWEGDKEVLGEKAILMYNKHV